MSQALAAEVADTVDPPAADEAAIEARARGMGWRPEAEYKGVGVWKSAAEYVKRAEEDIPLLRKRNRELEREVVNLAPLKTLVEEQKGVLLDLTERVRTSDMRGYERARKELLARRDEAIDAADRVTVHRIDQEVAELEKERPKPLPEPPKAAAAAAPSLPPEVSDWIGRNPWFSTDKGLADTATQISTALRISNPELSISENLAEVTRRVQRTFPERFPAARQDTPASREVPDDDNPRRHEPGAVSGSTASRGPASAKGRTFEAMPRDSKDAFTRYVRLLEGKGKPLTKEEWAATYWDQFPE
jgi:hypothetical protein